MDVVVPNFLGNDDNTKSSTAFFIVNCRNMWIVSKISPLVPKIIPFECSKPISSESTLSTPPSPRFKNAGGNLSAHER